MRVSVLAAAAAVLCWATGASAQETSSTTETAPPTASSGATVGQDGPLAQAGGSGNVSTQGYGYGFQQSYPLPSNTPPMNAPPPARTQEETERELRGVSVLVGGGVEGYTGSLAPRVQVGPAWNLLIGFHPSSVLGLELDYVGAINSVKFANFGLATPGGADIVRNGGHAAVTFAFGPWLVRPFILAGVGVNHYSVSDNAKGVGFSDTTAGYIPVGGGLRGQVANEKVTIDLRGTWSLPFRDNLFPGGTGQNTLGLSTGNYGRWNATLNVGAMF